MYVLKTPNSLFVMILRNRSLVNFFDILISKFKLIWSFEICKVHWVKMILTE